MAGVEVGIKGRTRGEFTLSNQSKIKVWMPMKMVSMVLMGMELAFEEVELTS